MNSQPQIADIRHDGRPFDNGQHPRADIVFYLILYSDKGIVFHDSFEVLKISGTPG